jgi:hypothetical protein
VLTDTVRPLSVRFAGLGTAVPSGTLATVTADDSDATYIDMNAADTGNNWSLRLGPHTLTSGYGRHRIRGRIRIRTDAGTCTEDIDLGRGTQDFIEYDTVPATNVFTNQATGWFQNSGYGLDTVGPLSDLNIGGGWLGSITGAAELRTAECYVDIDCRFHPDFSPEIQDNAGVDQSGGTVTDTNQPVMFFGTVNYDGLPSLAWEVTVRAGVSGGPTIFTQSGSGTPPSSVNLSTGLDNGDYNATFIVSSTIRGADPFEHSEVLVFEINNEVPPPSPPLVTVTPEYGGYRVSWTFPGGQAWDGDYVVAEVWRDDCVGSQRIAVVPDGLSGSYLDLAIPQLDPQPDVDCEPSSVACDITYRVRYQGYVSTSVELPDTIPADLILAWPSTAASIPAGWSRVTSLDGFHVRGATTTGAPSATGGATSHTHTTPAHLHRIGPHNHTLGGPTGASNLSITSRRENGAAYAQSDQPHNHTRPEYVGTFNGGDSGSASPDTGSTSNLPLARDVIWIQSNGLQVAYPVGALGYSTESVSGWTDDATSASRFLKGAAAAGNGGATSGVSSHGHTVASHGHTGLVHDHTVGNTSLSNPASSIEAGGGSGGGRWLPRHTHPMNVVPSTTGNLDAAAGGTAGTTLIEPPNRRLRILRNTGGGRQTRIIGVYTGALVDLDPILTACDGTNGTPDMRTLFARERGSSSVNLVGGATTHTHPISTHTHTSPGHNHTTVTSVSTNSSNGTPTSPGDLGPSPDRDHDHSSADTGITGSPVASAYFPSALGVPLTGAGNNIPVYKEVHFVRVDGIIGGDPLPVPELKISDFASFTVPSLTYSDGLDRLSSFTDRMAVVTDRASDFPRLVADSVPLEGGLHSVSTSISGEDLSLVISAEGLPAINRLEAMLANDRLYWSPLGGTPGWFAPAGWTVTAPAPTVKVVQVTMVRQPWPETPEPGEFL